MKRVALGALALAGLTQLVCADPADDALARMKTCLRSDGPARTECVDSLWWELTGEATPAPAKPTAAPSAASSNDHWIVSETTSPVDYSPQIAAALQSYSSAENAPASLAIRCRGSRSEISVSTAGSWRASAADELRVAYRINEQPIVETRWAATADGRTAVFKGDAILFLQTLPESGQISVRVYDGLGRTHEGTFQLNGFDAVRPKLAAACKRPPAVERAFSRKR
jgi:hypothetical protein